MNEEQKARTIKALSWMTTTILFQEMQAAGTERPNDIVLSDELSEAINLLEELKFERD